jgi:hypothetical protein
MYSVGSLRKSQSQSLVLAAWLLGSWVRIPTRGMDVCLCVSVLCCLVSVDTFAAGWSLVQRSRTKCLNKITKPPEWGGQGPYKDCRAIDDDDEDHDDDDDDILLISKCSGAMDFTSERQWRSWVLRPIRELSGSNIGLETVNPGWGLSSVPSGECRGSILKLGHNRFLPNHLQFIIHLSPYHSTLCSFSYWNSVVK